MLEEIIVTAEKREQALSDVPMAIAAFGQETIENRGYTNLESFFRQVPSVSLLDGGAQRKQVIIRGIAIDAGVRAGGLSSTYVDETLVTGGSFALDPRMFDMERVEVLKGPQGTLYGGGSISGSVRYITNKPNTEEFQTNIAFDTSKTQGAKQGYSFDAMLNIPLVEGVLGFRAVAFSADNSGYYDNPYLGLTSQGQFDQTGGRLSLLWTPTDTFTATGTYFVDETFQDGWYRATGDDWAAREQANRMQEVLTADAQILGLNLEWDVGWATITSATAMLDFYSYRKVDRTFLGIDDPVDGHDERTSRGARRYLGRYPFRRVAHRVRPPISSAISTGLRASITRTSTTTWMWATTSASATDTTRTMPETDWWQRIRTKIGSRHSPRGMSLRLA